MIDLIRIDHVSMAVPDRNRQVELLERLFGFRWMSSFEDEEGYNGATLAVPGRSGVTWEVLAPNGPESYLQRFLDGPHGPGLHHLTYLVRSVRQAAEAIRGEGTEPWGLREREPRQSGVVYLHPRHGGRGFLFQFLESDPATEAAPEWRPDDAGEDDHTLGVIAVDHLAHAGPDREDLAEWYERLFGYHTIHRSPADGAADGFQTRVVEGIPRQMHIETIAPAGEDSFIARFLERRGGPAMHHVTFEVGDWDRAVEACAHHEVPIFGERSGETDDVPWREAFIHPRDTGGVLVQFFWQAEPGVWI